MARVTKYDITNAPVFLRIKGREVKLNVMSVLPNQYYTYTTDTNVNANRKLNVSINDPVALYETGKKVRGRVNTGMLFTFATTAIIALIVSAVLLFTITTSPQTTSMVVTTTSVVCSGKVCSVKVGVDPFGMPTDEVENQFEMRLVNVAPPEEGDNVRLYYTPGEFSSSASLENTGLSSYLAMSGIVCTVCTCLALIVS